MASGSFLEWILTGLNKASALDGEDRIHVVQGGVSKYTDIEQIAAAVGGGGGGGSVDSVNDVAPVSGNVSLTLDDIPDGADSVAYTPTEKTKLAGIEADATENQTDAYLLARANHTGVQAASTISDFSTAADARITAQKAQANGLATLGADSKIPSAQLPAIAVTDTFVVASQVAMLALTAEVGDVAVRTDESKTYILSASPASTLANWVWMQTPAGGVTSVNGNAGPSVTLTTSDIAEGTNEYHTAAKVRAVALTGLSLVTATAITAADSILTAAGKLQAQITALNPLTTVLTGLSLATSTAVTAADTILAAIGKLQAQITINKVFWAQITAKAPVNDTVPMVTYSPIAATVLELNGVKVASGTLTLELQINGVAVTGLAALAITATPQNFTATAANTIAVGQRAEWVITNASGPPSRLQGTCKMTR